MFKSSRMVTFLALLVCYSFAPGFGPTPANARDWNVPAQAPTIQSAMDSCVTGDVVVIEPGLYEDCTHLSNGVLHIAVLPVGVSVRGATGDPADVVLDAGYLGRCFEIRNNTEAFSIEGITMRRGRAVSPLGKGGAVFAMFSDPVFRHCVFDSNYADFGGGGISAGYGNLTLENCVFKGNETDGIGAAVQVSRTPTTITSSTFYGSRGAAIHYATDEITLDKCIIASGDAEALAQNLASDPDPVITCTNIFGNLEDYSEFFSSYLGQDGNISVEPLFCNPLFGDLHLYAVSPCAQENSGTCGLIGALPVGCGTGASTYVIQANGTGDFPTIQAAINVAASGDTINLADGTFTGDGNRDLDFLGKAITVQGQNGDPSLAIIDCQGTELENHRGFIFQNDEAASSILRDISIRNGNVVDDGGGILCKSSPLIENCHIFQNHAERGGGIFCDHGSPEINNCQFYENEGRARAGGIGLLASRAMITNSMFTANWGYMGAAVFLPDSSEVTMTGCTITNNANSLDKATIGLDGNSSLDITNSIVAFGPQHAFGEYDIGEVTISGCDVYGHGVSDYSGPIASQNGVSGNISADPVFCDGDNRDFSIRGDSPCTAASAPNSIQMGYLGVGCAAPSIFEDMSANLPETFAASSGVNLLDWNNDGNLDLHVVNEGSANEAYDGGGDFSFTPHADDLATFYFGGRSGAFADYDADGDLDLYLTTPSELPNLLGDNDQGVFTIVSADSLQHLGAFSAANWCDFNQDGFLDLFSVGSDSNSILMTADADGLFTNTTPEPLADTGQCVTAAWADYDNDGDQDLYLVHDGQPDMLFTNADEFTRVEGDPLENPGAGRGAAWGDYDNDGDLDLYLTVAEGANQLLENDGDGEFSDVQTGPLSDAGPGRSGIWGDWDNDGDLDLFLANCGTSDRLLRNNGGTFLDTGDTVFAAADSSEGAAWGDIDSDGDLDLTVAVRGGRSRLYRNNQVNGNHWLKLDLRSLHGMVGSVGARVQIFTGPDTTQIREVSASNGWRSSDDLTVHFGLGAETLVDSLRVTWPGGQPLVLNDVAVDQLLVLVEEFTETVSDVPANRALRSFRLEQAFPNPFNPSTTIRFSVPESRQVSLCIYDVAGRLIKVLLDEHQEAGEHEAIWRGRDRSDRNVAAGVYFVRLQAGRFTQARTITLVK
jgi:ASPIC and UnbV/FG-GAP-like repeat/Right handed beta helix region